MSKPYPNYLFHIPGTGNRGGVFDFNKLEKKMKSNNPPEVVGVIDNTSKKRIGVVPANIALIKFK